MTQVFAPARPTRSPATQKAATTGYPPLVEVLGVAWRFEAPVVALAWDELAGSVAYASAEGTLAVAPARWMGGPQLLPRDGGGLTLVAAEAPAPAPRRATVHEDACTALAADPAGGFLSGGADGRVVQMPLDGRGTVLARLDAAIDRVASGAGGARAWSAGRQAERWRNDDVRRIEAIADVQALAFDPSGDFLALAHAGGVTLWSGAAAPGTAAECRLLGWPGSHRTLAWRADGLCLASGLQDHTLHAWQLPGGVDLQPAGTDRVRSGGVGPSHSLAFTGDGAWLVASGGHRAVCWRVDAAGRFEAGVGCGLAGAAPISRIASHPQRALFAVGHDDGTVGVCRPGLPDTLRVRAAGEGSVTALAWSGDGSRLAYGTDGGAFGWLALPQALFRDTAAAH